MRTLSCVLLLLLACRTSPEPRPPVHDPLLPSKCLQAETALLDLGCTDSQGVPFGGPNRAGVPFRQICQDAVENHLSLNPTCLAALNDCRLIQDCL